MNQLYQHLKKKNNTGIDFLFSPVAKILAFGFLSSDKNVFLGTHILITFLCTL